MLTEVLLLIAALLAGIWVWHKHALTYWDRKRVRHLKPTAVFGTFKELFTGKASFPIALFNMHNAPGFEKDAVVGIYLCQRPGLLIRDLDLVKTVLIKKFNHFSNRAVHADKHHDAIGNNNLFFVRNPEWRELRAKISPVFSSGKVKQMYPLMVDIAKNLETHLAGISSGSDLAIKEVCARFTTDLIATIAFGLQANALQDEKSEFYYCNRSMVTPTIRRGIDFAVILMLPSLTALTRAKVFPKEMEAFVRRSIGYVIAEREKSGQKRNDLIDILVAMKREAAAEPDKPHLAHNFDYLVSQAAIFQSAGYETSSSTMNFTLYELAKHMDLQDRLRSEILDYFGNEDHITYERIQEMPYLTQVVNETLRLYPVIPNLERECTPPLNEKPFTLAPYYDFEVPAGMPIYISVLGIHRDEKYWPEPLKFDPERFAPENRANLNMDAYLPFGTGPHNCIGMRLGLLQTKLGLVHFLRNHRVVMSDKTIKDMQYEVLSFPLTPKSTLLLKLERI